MSATVRHVLAFQARDVARSRWLAEYGIFFLAATEGLLRFTEGDARTMLGLVNVVLLVVPLVTIVFGVTYLHAAREFVELLLAQPVTRGRLFAGLYLGLTLPLAGAVLLGIGIPFLFRGVEAGARGTLATLGAVAVILTAIFAALAFWIAVRTEDRLRGLGAAIAVWLGLAVLYDGVVLFLVSTFADYPLERATLAMTLANPVDLARVLLLLRLDVAALMGYTGAVFHRFFAGAAGTFVALGALATWTALPIALAGRAFRRRDF